MRAPQGLTLCHNVRGTLGSGHFQALSPKVPLIHETRCQDEGCQPVQSTILSRGGIAACVACCGHAVMQLCGDVHAVQDKHSGQHLHLMRYFLAEGVVIGQVRNTFSCPIKPL